MFLHIEWIFFCDHNEEVQEKTQNIRFFILIWYFFYGTGGKRLPPLLDTHNTRGVTSALSVFGGWGRRWGKG